MNKDASRLEPSCLKWFPIMPDKFTKKPGRHSRMVEEIRRNPFVTDEDLAALLGVSIPTVRLDRQELSIPEVRKRTREMAGHYFGVSQSLPANDIIGELIEIEPGQRGLSILETDQSMCLKKCDIVRGHFIFAQVNSLAAAVADSPVALTGRAEVDFLRPVRAGEKLIAKVRVLEKRGHRLLVDAVVRSREEIVCTGSIVIYGMTLEMANYLKLLKDAE